MAYCRRCGRIVPFDRDCCNNCWDDDYMECSLCGCEYEGDTEVEGVCDDCTDFIQRRLNDLIERNFDAGELAVLKDLDERGEILL